MAGLVQDLYLLLEVAATLAHPQMKSERQPFARRQSLLYLHTY